jgi:hypothetical protein
MKEIGNIGNYYGGLIVKEEDECYFWGILDWDDDVDWEEIPKALYDALIAYQEEHKYLFEGCMK